MSITPNPLAIAEVTSDGSRIEIQGLRVGDVCLSLTQVGSSNDFRPRIFPVVTVDGQFDADQPIPTDLTFTIVVARV